MSSLCGGLRAQGIPRETIERMLDSMAGLAPVSEHLTRGGFTVSTTQPGLAGEIERIATSEDGAVTAAFAGYLYTEDLEARSKPAQHCLDAYERSGLEFPLDLNGTFAVVIHDGRTGSLHLISDRLCTRALYYCRQPEAFLFASEVKAILEYPGVSRKLNEERLLEFLTIETVLGCDTYYDHIRQVPPASVLTWDGHEISISEYWRPVFRYDEGADIDESAERIAAAIRGAMRRICAGVDRAALMLSGGLDSRTIAAASPIPLHCMTMHSEEYMPDLRSAHQTASALHFEHEFIRLPETYPLELLTEGTMIGDGMHPFHHAQGLYLRHAIADGSPQLLLNGYAVDLYFQGGEMPRPDTRTLKRLAGPARMVAESELNPVECLLRHSASGSDPWAGIAQGNADAPDAGLRSRAHAAAADLTGMAAGPHDLADLLVIRNSSKCYSHLNLLTMARLTGEGLPAWDNEITDAWLSTPPHQRYRYRAYRRAIALIDRRMIDIPNRGVPPYLNEWREHYHLLFHYGVVVPLRRRFWRAFRPGQRVPVEGGWPLFGGTMAARPEWQDVLRRRAATSRLVDLGVLSGDGLAGQVERFIGQDRSLARQMCAWLTLEEWLEAYGEA